jgi:hypothetical protein
MSHEIQPPKINDNVGHKPPAIEAGHTNYSYEESKQAHAAAKKPANEIAQNTIQNHFGSPQFFDSSTASMDSKVPGANPSVGQSPGSPGASYDGRAVPAGKGAGTGASASETTVQRLTGSSGGHGEGSTSGTSLDFDQHPNIYGGAAYGARGQAERSQEVAVGRKSSTRAPAETGIASGAGTGAASPHAGADAGVAGAGTAAHPGADASFAGAGTAAHPGADASFAGPGTAAHPGADASFAGPARAAMPPGAGEGFAGAGRAAPPPCAGEGLASYDSKFAGGLEAPQVNAVIPEIQNNPTKAVEREPGAAANDSGIPSNYSLSDGSKLALTFPRPERLSNASAHDLKQMFDANQAALTKMMQHSRSALPILAFHGSDEAGMNKLTSERTGTSKTGDPERFYVSTISQKSWAPKTFLADYIRAANVPTSYGKQGGMAVFNISNRADDKGHLSMVTEHPGTSPNIQQLDTKYCGETTIILDPQTFDHLFKGIVPADKLTTYKLPYDDSTAESHHRSLMATGLNEQAVLVEALKVGGALQSDQ